MPRPADAAFLTDEWVDALVQELPLEGYAMLCEFPAGMKVEQFRVTLRRWARRIAEVAIETAPKGR